LLADEDPICQQMGRVMASFKLGLFAGGDRGDWPRDNLDLERWFRLPKGHERRIHGRCHAGVRIVQEGATMMLAWTPIATIHSRSARSSFGLTVTPRFLPARRK